MPLVNSHSHSDRNRLLLHECGVVSLHDLLNLHLEGGGDLTTRSTIGMSLVNREGHIVILEEIGDLVLGLGPNPSWLPTLEGV